MPRATEATLRRAADETPAPAARQWLLQEMDVPWPLVSSDGLERLATAGGRIYYQDEVGWLDASAGGQFPIGEVVEPLLQRLDFDPSGMASAWRPAEGILLNPEVQAGAPRLEGTRLTTELVADLVAVGEDPEDIADDYAVDLSLVNLAIGYERALAA